MATDDDDTPTSSDPMFATARELLAAVGGEDTANEFADAVEERVGTGNVTEAVLGGLAAGEQINQLREQSRQIQTHATAQEPPFAVQTRTVVADDSGEHVGTAIYVDDGTVEYYRSDDAILLRSSEGEATVDVPQGVGTVDAEYSDGMCQLLVRPPGYDDAAGRRLHDAADADSPASCKLCYDLSTQPGGPDTCSHHDTPISASDPEGTTGETPPPDGDSDDTAADPSDTEDTDDE